MRKVVGMPGKTLHVLSRNLILIAARNETDPGRVKTHTVNSSPMPQEIPELFGRRFLRRVGRGAPLFQQSSNERADFWAQRKFGLALIFLPLRFRAEDVFS